MLRFVPVALALILAGAAALLLATAHLVVGIVLAVLALALAGLIVWARLATKAMEPPAAQYVERESLHW